jgi:hypothetical protein
MASLQDKLTALFLKLADGDSHLRTLPNGHVSGHVISSEFETLDYEARRLRLRQVIDAAVAAGVLTTTETLAISTLLTYTPAEWSAPTVSN